MPHYRLRTRIATLLLCAFLLESAVTVIMIALMHIFDPPVLEPFRVPTALRRAAPVWGLAWPGVMHIYHVILGLILANLLVNVVALARISASKWKAACQISAASGTLVAGTVWVYFLVAFFVHRPLTRLDHQSAAIFASYGLVLLMVNILTFLVTYDFTWRGLAARLQRFRRLEAREF